MAKGQNDHKSREIICPEILLGGRANPNFQIETFYASGETGKEVRADGNGGSLARGYWARWRTSDLLHGSWSRLSGAYTTRIKAICGAGSIKSEYEAAYRVIWGIKATQDEYKPRPVECPLCLEQVHPAELYCHKCEGK